ncbi:precorrin-6A synthase (deacetylating) [Rhodoplanes sp. TEM]|uniref:Precorrin-6A synthase [deacetylating] n=1 Tax=Rhodoplanes tepidamans TaxID=200616 RepID=A0ABT5JC71_RHOTP|nr:MULTISPECIES: precorrin-6A synthase (deacetylating) [Rhodoplanes]MDC7787202.1 precorrin-6A synthase (deacetylating) [Rhodoplanes tepidamans]MDC7984168.1 precorrin-6A synthase (deacetylating) [Rhodoplanes sp. TEM]MDQ0356031.1 precorrin-6A synthase [Rhodoplanes tepidamans]
MTQPPPRPVRTVSVVGIGSGDPDQITLQAIDTLRRSDVVFVPEKGAGKAELAQVRQAICARFAGDRPLRTVAYAVPARRDTGDYGSAVADWHTGLAATFTRLLREELGDGERGAFLVWGDPAFYDSTIRVLNRVEAAGEIALAFDVVPGIGSVQALAAKHRIPLAEIGGSILITTGRRLAAGAADVAGTAGAETVVVMLDRGDGLRAVDPDHEVFWGACLGTADERLVAGRVGDVIDTIARERQACRDAHGWVMDVFVLKKPRTP